MEGFNSYEEIASHCPIDNFSNVIWRIDKKEYLCLVPQDLEYIKELYPYGYFDEPTSTYNCCVPFATSLYDGYVYDGDKWYPAIKTWDGYMLVSYNEIIEMKNHKCNYHSKEEAEKQCKILSNF